MWLFLKIIFSRWRIPKKRALGLCQYISISSSDICSSDCREEAPPPTAIVFNNSIEVRTTWDRKKKAESRSQMQWQERNVSFLQQNLLLQRLGAFRPEISRHHRYSDSVPSVQLINTETNLPIERRCWLQRPYLSTRICSLINRGICSTSMHEALSAAGNTELSLCFLIIESFSHLHCDEFLHPGPVVRIGPLLAETKEQGAGRTVSTLNEV